MVGGQNLGYHQRWRDVEIGLLVFETTFFLNGSQHRPALELFIGFLLAMDGVGFFEAGFCSV
ncbi:hypothetical protein H744_2c2527 [Photobacterium gaetbulicola Gung47]|uniref:Uncharacterized protein n=1 Tax=Photobacterium gaetbulicola Gung47 TaxID=658445 RepID=A0A0C5WPY9_9GAMM|nr:hypothetical protein H744_2c2527 [Photobacterium gaetbulicola Gung47]